MIRTTIRIPKTMHYQIRKESFESGMSQNEIFLEMVRERYKEELKMTNLQVKKISAEDLVQVFDLFDTEEEEREFVANSQGKTYTLTIYENESTISEVIDRSATDTLFDVYTEDLSMEDLEELNGTIERLD